MKLPERKAWENRFAQPSLDALSEHYPKQLATLFAHARDRLLEFDAIHETISWQGLPWRWCLVYSTDGDPTPAWTYLVPDPEGVTLCVPVNQDIVDSMPMKRLKKHIRDAIYMGKQVEQTIWATWQLTAKTQVDEVLDIAKRKHKYITALNAADS